MNKDANAVMIGITPWFMPPSLAYLNENESKNTWAVFAYQLPNRGIRFFQFMLPSFYKMFEFSLSMNTPFEK